jgi:hypothetical protein
MVTRVIVHYMEFVPARGFEDLYEVSDSTPSYIRVRARRTKRIVKRAFAGHVSLRDNDGRLQTVDVKELLPAGGEETERIRGIRDRIFRCSPDLVSPTAYPCTRAENTDNYAVGGVVGVGGVGGVGCVGCVGGVVGALVSFILAFVTCVLSLVWSCVCVGATTIVVLAMTIAFVRIYVYAYAA